MGKKILVSVLLLLSLLVGLNLWSLDALAASTRVERQDQSAQDSPIKRYQAKIKKIRRLSEKRKSWRPKDKAKNIDKNSLCIDCHKEATPGIFNEWVDSRHADIGVGCYDCHQAKRDDPDSFRHEERFFISILVTPFDCAKCHKKITREYYHSAHAKALKNLEQMKESDPLYFSLGTSGSRSLAGCSGCHGSKIELEEDGRPTNKSWPNNGAGRLNPDSSRGNCAICHTRHSFSVEGARRPETCLKCHSGKDYPEGEIYWNSPHGILYRQQRDEIDLDRPGFFCTVERFKVPTCAICHFNGAGKGLVTRHDPAFRLNRDLNRPDLPLPSLPYFEDVKESRPRMKRVCLQCHAKTLVDNFFDSADQELHRYQVDYVQPNLERFLEGLARKKGSERDRAAKEYMNFLSEVKRYRLQLYMGAHGTEVRGAN
jgi:hypothetical protein